jgi:hypothetical protein
MFENLFNRPKKSKTPKRADWDAPGPWLLTGPHEALTRLEIQRVLSLPRIL